MSSIVPRYAEAGIGRKGSVFDVTIFPLPRVRSNLTTAKALGLDVSPSLLAIADEVIE